MDVSPPLSRSGWKKTIPMIKIVGISTKKSFFWFRWISVVSSFQTWIQSVRVLFLSSLQQIKKQSQVKKLDVNTSFPTKIVCLFPPSVTHGPLVLFQTLSWNKWIEDELRGNVMKIECIFVVTDHLILSRQQKAHQINTLSQQGGQSTAQWLGNRPMWRSHQTHLTGCCKLSHARQSRTLWENRRCIRPIRD